MANKTRIGILLSGRGSNFVAIANNIDAEVIPNAEISVVISNKPNTQGIQTAQERGLQTAVVISRGRPRSDQEREVVAILKAFGVKLVCLAGYMRLLSPWFVQQFPNRILNIHPALLPAFPGNHAHRDTLAHGVKISGCTVHLVDEECDHGPIIVQRSVPVHDSDTEQILSERILQEEHLAYTEAINIVLDGTFKLAPRHLAKG